jgi:hypothetical protein
MSTAAEPKSSSYQSKNGLKNLAIGAAIQVFEVSTLGQPFEVIKTHMAGTLNFWDGILYLLLNS